MVSDTIKDIKCYSIPFWTLQTSFYETASAPSEFESRIPENVVAVVAVRILGRIGLEDGRRSEVDAADLSAVREGILVAACARGIHRRR